MYSKKYLFIYLPTYIVKTFIICCTSFSKCRLHLLASPFQRSQLTTGLEKNLPTWKLVKDTCVYYSLSPNILDIRISSFTFIERKISLCSAKSFVWTQALIFHGQCKMYRDVSRYNSGQPITISNYISLYPRKVGNDSSVNEVRETN